MTQAAISLAAPTHHADLPTYGHLRFRAVIDWIDIRIKTTVPSNHDTVTTRTGVPFAEAILPGPGGATTEFRLRFHEPNNWNAIDSMLERFTHDHPLAEPAQIVGIEIALDAYSRAGNKNDLVDMTFQFYRRAQFLCSENRRMSNGKITHAIGSRGLNRTDIEDGFNLYIGDRHDDIKQHIYLKQITHEDGHVVALPTEQHRARTEFTLKGAQLPEQTLEAWKGLEFQKFARLFKFRAEKTNMNAAWRRAFQSADQIGERKPRRNKHRGVRFFSPLTQADKNLSESAYTALRELSRRMQAERRNLH
jgi:hypothetical protein